jgi:hypothetical protein
MVDPFNTLCVLVLSMLKPLVLTVFYLTCAFASSAHAFGPKLPNNAGLRDARDSEADDVLRRKTELRSALQAQKPGSPPDGPTGAVAAPPARQLSDQDRADLRQQIRQQRP